MDEEQTGDHRRDFLKKVAVGGAVAWTAPVVLSSRASASEYREPATDVVDRPDGPGGVHRQR